MMSSLLNSAKIQCTQCHSLNIRRSKWVSHAEKKSYPEGSPYRCLDCSKRFIADKEASHLTERNLFLTRLFLAAILLVGGAVFLFFLLENSAKNYPQQSGFASVSSAENNSARMKAAERGDAQAQFELGQSLLQTFNGNPEETAVAVRWLRKSAISGNTDAMVALGRLSKTGVGVLQSYVQSLEWIQTAAYKGNPEGMLELGRLYRDGVAVPKDSVQAYIWLNRAAAMQNRIAALERDLIAGSLTAEKLKEAQSLSSVEAPKK